MKKIIILTMIAGILIFPYISSAALGGSDPTQRDNLDATTKRAVVQKVDVTEVSGVQDLVIKVIKWIQVFFFVIATAFIIMTAFTYLTSKGEAEKITEAKKSLVYALIAIAVALLASGMRALVCNFLGGTGC